MKRRDFLLLRTEGTLRVMELSCQQLYVYYRDCLAEMALSRQQCGSLQGSEWWQGEPTLSVKNTDINALFSDLARQLTAIDYLLLIDSEWLKDAELNKHMNNVLREFKKRGGVVQHRSAAMEAAQ